LLSIPDYGIFISVMPGAARSTPEKEESRMACCKPKPAEKPKPAKAPEKKKK